MLDGLLGTGFKAKCKSEIKSIKARIEIARRRAEAKQRFLKDDLAKLLVNGLDVDAFNRTEEYLVGQNILASYDFIEQTCEYITGQLSCMQRQRECPEECREAVGSLMFAAARFSDLPELRDLRNLLRERYGNSLECFVNQKFLEKLNSRPPERETKIRLLEDISSEYSLKWDAKGFEQRMAPPSNTVQIQSQSSKHGSNYVALKEYNQLRKNYGSAKPSNCEYPTTEKRSELANAANGGDKMHSSAEGTFYSREDNIPKSKKQDVLRQNHNYVNNGERKHGYREGFSKEEYSTTETEKRDVTKQRPELVKAKDQVQQSKDVEYLRRKKPDIHNPNDTMEGMPEKLNNEILFHNGKAAEKFKSNHAKEDGCQQSMRSRRSHDTKRSENVDTGFMIQNNRVNNNSKGNSEITPLHGQSPVDRQDLSSTPKYINERDVEKFRTNGLGENSVPVPPYSRSINGMLPPPYTKPRDGKHKSSGVSKHANSEYDGPSGEPSSQNTDRAVDLSENTHKEGVQIKQEEERAEQVPLETRDPEDHLDHKDMIPLPKPRSIRRKHRRSSRQNEVSSTEDVEPIRRGSNSRRRESSRKGLQILFDDENPKQDKEEKVIDKMLLHYCKKPSSFDIGKLVPKSNAHPAEQRTVHAAESSHGQRKYVQDEESEHVQVPTRSLSLPHKHTSPPEAIKAFTRVNSLQPDNQARHVHPKLPDYEDFVERMATLRGK
ncbi:hypothetical protein Leryth_024582 [Lithospermum erythrorhizon]|nr:hypothetical protein Leryth_024582 [Lithospermum erythrorhizon]